MRFQVPQFIEMDDTIFGPLSFKEFAYLAGGAGLSFLLYRFIPSNIIAVILIAPVITFALCLSFYKPNNKPFIDMVQSAVIYFFGHKLYIWHKQNPLVVSGKDANDFGLGAQDPLVFIPKTGQNKLTNLSFNLDTQKKKEPGDQSGGDNNSIQLQI